ncbi:ABC transporter ATP-binding protein [Microbacterium abyssi]|uniref:ABC transporter ATP-binding protein n=1 Tax=Microbacterium abyssi TaxID=2782166 RepID=UPI00188880A0|nr:ATP-binding cassette domain-containing protein [Microbacterium sp. A18JL241]
MADGQLIEFDHATKRFGAVAAVSDFSARVNPGVVTGFLGPNGAGKTTTLRMLLGLERPTSGTATIGGSRYAELRSPARVIGAMMEDPGFRPRRSVERHLITAAKAGGIPLSRVGELLSFVGLGNDADTRIAALSLGMRQRLSAATALLGDPGVLVLDEPANGLDPEGIRWMRTLIRGLADEGRTVLVSSHVLSEVEQIADEILVIAHGELKFAGTMEDLADPQTGPVVVDAADRSALSESLKDAGYEFEILRSGLTVRGSDAATIGGITARAGVALTTLQQRGPTLEDVFLDLVHDRYVKPAPLTDETALFELPVDAPEDAVEAVEDAEQEQVQAEEEQVNDPQETDASEADTERVAPRAEGETKRAERAERDEASSSDESASADERPLPGIADLAAVASMFANPVTDPSIAAAGIEAAEAEEAEEADPENFDATRVIDVVPSFEADADAGSDAENSDAEQR